MLQIKCMSTKELIKDFYEKLWTLGNHQEYGMF